MIYFGNNSIRKHAGSLFKISAILAILVLLSYLRTVCEAHTILLVQPNHKAETRTYSDYESLNECLEGICKIFEEHLKRCHPDQPSITYDISQLFDFIDKLKDLCCLVYQKNIKLYCPHSKEWLKEKIYIMLRKQAGKA